MFLCLSQLFCNTLCRITENGHINSDTETQMLDEKANEMKKKTGVERDRGRERQAIRRREYSTHSATAQVSRAKVNPL